MRASRKDEQLYRYTPPFAMKWVGIKKEKTINPPSNNEKTKPNRKKSWSLKNAGLPVATNAHV